MPIFNSALRTPYSALRRGISLLEVLISIFIISVGILGVAAMLPLATHLANRGATSDRAAIAGKEALRQFMIRGMNNTDLWLQANGTGTSLNAPLNPTGAKAYCLDPIGVAHGATANFGSPGMQRITLRPEPGDDWAAPLTAAHQRLFADELCRVQDDLNFNLPDDPTAPPAQRTLDNENGTPGSQGDDYADKRLSDGDFSWLATLVRERAGDRYTLSAVVIHNRDTNTGNFATANTLEHVVVAPNTSLVGGVGGGDLTLTTSGVPAAAREHLVPGRWIMLSSLAGDVYRWYRIVGTSDFSGTQAEFTLAGRDWDVTVHGVPNVTIIPGAVAAYERTVRLETSSMWQP